MSSSGHGRIQPEDEIDVKAPTNFGFPPVRDCQRISAPLDSLALFNTEPHSIVYWFHCIIQKLGLTRQLTKHVVTRWYRAPELILIQPYTSAVDIWSLGCILAELLSMQDGNVPGYQDRKPLFPGGSCFPLSGEGDIKSDERLDQLSVIFQVIGMPSPEDIASIGKANEYIESLGKIERKPLETIYPAADPAAIDLLKKMLMFNPKQRCTAEDALEHEFFKGVRRKDLEQASSGPLEGPDFLESENIDLQVLKQRTYDEILWYRDQAPNTDTPQQTEPHVSAP
jgi:mitogen-activated protein kinase 1/3